MVCAQHRSEEGVVAVKDGKWALLVIDMQKCFTDPGGTNYYPEAAELVRPIGSLVECAREAGVPVIWTIDWHRSSAPDSEFGFLPPHCLDGTMDVQMADGLEVAANEVVIRKRRYSAFLKTDLDICLRELGVNNIMCVGNKTNVCVRATVQDGFGLGYHMYVVRQCVASNRGHLHEASLEDIHRYMGIVVELEDAYRLLTTK